MSDIATASRHGVDYELADEVRADTLGADEGARRSAADDDPRPRARAGDDGHRARRRGCDARRAASPTTSRCWWTPGCCRSCAPRRCGRSTSATTAAPVARSFSSTRRTRSRSSTTCSPRPTSSSPTRSPRADSRIATRGSRGERVEEYVQRLFEITLEFIAEPRDGDIEYGLYVGMFPTNRRIAPVDGRRLRPDVVTS